MVRRKDPYVTLFRYGRHEWGRPKDSGLRSTDQRVIQSESLRFAYIPWTAPVVTTTSVTDVVGMPDNELIGPSREHWTQ